MPKSQRIADIVDLRIARFDAIISSKVIAHTIAKKESLNIQTGQIMELFCTAHGQPLPEINWFKDGGLVTSRSASNNFVVSRFGTSSTLRITDMKAYDSGTYACRAENINGHISKWVFVTVSPRVEMQTKYSTTMYSQSKLKKILPKSLCDLNPCNIGECYEKDNGSSYECKCPFPYNGIKCQNNILLAGNKRNSSALEERSINCNKKSNISVNDQLFTIFETILVCIIASLFLGILCYIFRRKYCCFYTKSKTTHKGTSQSIQAEINNFILVRDVGINVNGHHFEHGCDRLMPVAYKRNVSMIFQEARFQEISQTSRLLSNSDSAFAPPIIYEDTVQTQQFYPYFHRVLNNSSQPPVSVYYNKSVIQDNHFRSSNEALNIDKVNENSKSESGICSCFDYSHRAHPLSSTLLIFNEAVSPSLHCHDSTDHVNSGLDNITM